MTGWIDTIGILFGGGGIAAIITAWTQRSKIRSDAQGEVAKHYETLVTRLEARIGNLELRVSVLEERNSVLSEATNCAYRCERSAYCPVLAHMNTGGDGSGA